MVGKPSAGKSIGVPVGETESVRIRQISNGWLISREGMKRGKFVQHEAYSVTKPVITADEVKRGAAAKAKR